MGDQTWDDAADQALERRLTAALSAPDDVAGPSDERVRALRAEATDDVPVVLSGPRPRRVDAAPSARRRPRPVTWLAAAAVLVAVAAAGVVVGQSLAPEPGRLEFTAALTAPGDGSGDGEVQGRFLETGRVIELDTSTLPILPTGEYYELWFLTTDAPEAPRISAGTFHPDTHGVSEVALFGAVDPTRYPHVEVTAEQGDGDPLPSDDVVLAGDVRLTDG